MTKNSPSEVTTPFTPLDYHYSSLNSHYFTSFVHVSLLRYNRSLSSNVPPVKSLPIPPIPLVRTTDFFPSVPFSTLTSVPSLSSINYPFPRSTLSAPDVVLILISFIVQCLVSSCHGEGDLRSIFFSFFYI